MNKLQSGATGGYFCCCVSATFFQQVICSNFLVTINKIISENRDQMHTNTFTESKILSFLEKILFLLLKIRHNEGTKRLLLSMLKIRPDTNFLIEKQSRIILVPLVSIFFEPLMKLKILNKVQESNPISISTCFSGSYWSLIYHYRRKLNKYMWATAYHKYFSLVEL